MAGAAPPMVYDYGGFPEELYHIRYAAAGSPRLALRAHSLVQQAGLPVGLDAERGFDHGTYSILAVTHPHADVPVFQVSLRADYDPQAHLRLGRALAPLRDEGRDGSSMARMIFSAGSRFPVIASASSQLSAQLIQQAGPYFHDGIDDGDQLLAELGKTVDFELTESN